MKTCYLHLGFHKTATTSFQLSCGNNREKLLDEGIYYPKFKHQERKGNRWNHSGNIKSLCKTRQGEKLNRIKYFNKIEYEKSLKQTNDLILSGEGFSCMKKDELETLRRNLVDNGFVIKAFGLVRSPYSFACSALQQTIKNGKFHSSIGLGDTYLFHSSENIKNYLPERSQQIKRLLDVFKDDLQLHSFKQAISYADGPVSFLLSQIKPSLPSRLKEYFKSSTPSLTNLQARLMNAINALTKLQKKEKIGKQLFTTQRLAIYKQTEHMKAEKFLLTEKEFALIESYYSKISQRMEKALGNTFVQENIQFSDPNIDPTFIAQAFTEGISSFMTTELK
jgi:hypothetical protein